MLAEWDPRLEQMIVTTSTQMPHVTKTGLADCLGLDEGQVRIVSPDVGGGFGYKGILLPEEIVCASIAHAARPAGALARGPLRAAHRPAPTAASITTSSPPGPTARGKLLGRGVRGDGRCRRLLVLSVRRLPGSGAGRLDPAGPVHPAAAALPHHLGLHQQAADPALSRRGADRRVLRHGDDARRAGAPARHRPPRRSGSPISCRPTRCRTATWSARCSTAATIPRRCAARWRPSTSTAIRARQAKGEAVGFGLATFCEQGAHGTSVYHAWGIPFVPGFEQAHVRLTPDGVLEVRVGVHSHGQGMETTLAQVAHEILGIHPDKVRVVHGDTALTPYSTGTWGSRAMVMAGGAVAEACRQLGRARRRDRRGAAAGAGGRRRGRATARCAAATTAARVTHRRRRPHLVPRAAEPAARRRQGRPRSHRGLPARSRHRHALLCLPCLRGRGSTPRPAPSCSRTT